MQQLVTVEFRGDTLSALEGADGVAIAVKPICERLGLSWGSQRNRLYRDPVLAEGVFVTNMPSPGGPQETVCLALRLINGWLFGIDVARVKPELRDDVLAYKRECYETLADRFLGPRAAERPITAPAPEAIEERNLRAEEHKLNLVARMQAMKGPAYAFALYRRLGLPVAEPEPPELEAETSPAHTFTAADVAETLRAFLRERDAGIVSIAAAGAASTWNRRGIVGFRHGSGDILLPRETWDVVMAAYGTHNAARTLAVAGHLMKDATNRLCVVARVNGKPMRVYRIRAGLLADA